MESNDSIRRQKQSTPKNYVWRAFISKGIIKLQFFTANMNSKKDFKILKNYKSDINILHPNGILLLDNDSKHKSKISVDYYI